MFVCLLQDGEQVGRVMISSGLALEGSHSGALGPLHFPPAHMSYVPPVPEFLRPLPKPAPLVPRLQSRPVSLVQHKEDQPQDEICFPPSIYNSKLFPPPPPHFSHYASLQGPYGMYPGHYTPFRDRPLPPNPNPPLSPLEAYPGPQSPHQYSPPAQVKPGQSLLREKDKKFKVPSGKEGSMKHRILTRPESKKKGKNASEVHQTAIATNNNTPTPSFSKGSLIQLASGELRKVETHYHLFF